MNKKDSRKKILLIINHGWTIRNFLFSSFLSKISEKCDVYLLTNLSQIDLDNMNIKIKGHYRTIPFVQNWVHERIDMRRAGYHFALAGSDTMKIKSSWAILNRSFLKNLRIRIETLIMTKIFGSLILSFLDRIDYLLTIRSANSKYYKKIFEELNFDLVFSTFSVIVDERLPLYVAKSLGIKTAVNIVSWDNLSSKGRLPYGIDKYFTWSRLMKNELKDFHNQINEENIIISGTPQFDFHKDKSLIIDRNVFCDEIGFDSKRKIILYSGVTTSLMPYEDKLIENFILAIKNKKVDGEVQLIVRLHPSDNGNRFDRLVEKYRDVKFFIPNRAHSGSKTRSLFGGIKDAKILMNTLYHAEIHINTASTMTLDAAILNKPIINICYEEKPEGKDRSFGIDIYKCTHYKPIVESKGVKLAFSQQDLIDYVNLYLNNNDEDEIGRNKIVEKICGPIDGKSGLRIAHSIIELTQK